MLRLLALVALCLFANVESLRTTRTQESARVARATRQWLADVEDVPSYQKEQSSGLRDGTVGAAGKVTELVRQYFAGAKQRGGRLQNVGANAQFINDMQSRGIALLEGMTSLPSARDEAWKYTSLKTLFQHNYQHSSTPVVIAGEVAPFLTQYIDSNCNHSHMVFVDGHFSPEHSDVTALKGDAGGVTFTTLSKLDASLLEHQRTLLESNRVDTDEQPRNSYASDTLSALGLANAADAAVVRVPAGVSVPVPLQVIFYSSARASKEHLAAYPSLIIDAEEGASLRIKQTFIGGGSGTGTGSGAGAGEDESQGCLVVGNTRVAVARGASVCHTYEQDLPSTARHIEVVSADVQGGGRYDVSVAQIGGRLGRVNVHVRLNDTTGNCSVIGVTLAHTKQSLDLHSSIFHNAREQVSRQQQRNVVGEGGEAIFKGRIRIPQQAQKTDSDQLCRSLMLGDRARVIAMPTLEITADDVTCSHGASVTDLDENSMFYLAARGIDRKEARKLLLRGFVLDVLGEHLLDRRAEARIIDKLTDMNPSLDEKGRGGERLVQRLVSM